MHVKILGTALSAAIAFAGTQASAQQVYKCQDAADKVTYASQECDKLGLRSAGEVKNKVNVAPAYKAPPRPAAPAPAPAEKAAPPTAEKAAEPERRCFTVKTRQGRRDPLQRQAGRDRQVKVRR
jgi:hypothetical protein